MQTTLTVPRAGGDVRGIQSGSAVPSLLRPRRIIRGSPRKKSSGSGL